MNALLDRARRAAHRVAGRARRRLSGGEDGFVLLESIIAISLIAFIMAAVGVEFVSGVAAVARQRATQSAAEVADSAMGQLRALKPSDLVTGRGATSVQTQFTQGNAIAAISPWLQKMDQTSDATALTTAGANATIPTCDPAPHVTAPAACIQKPATVAYTVAEFLGTCWVDTSIASAKCVPTAQKTTGSVQYLRAVVSVGWTSGTCTAGCYYVSSTLISAAADPTFRANQPPPASPAIIVPGDQTNRVGDNVTLQLALQMGTGIPAYTWGLTVGSLPAGLRLSTGGLITGTVQGPASSARLTVRVIDGYGRQDTATFTWTVITAPPVSACPPSVTLANPSFEAPVVAAGAGINVTGTTANLGWKTTSSTNQIEFWSNGGNSQSNNGGTAITAENGNQWVEVNGSGMDTLYQDLPTTPGQVLQWSLWHRARNATNNVTAQDSIQVQLGSVTKQTAQIPRGATSATISDGASGWVQYTGTYTVPAAQQTTRFQVAATATSSGSTSIGNFLDDVRVAGVACLSPAAQFSTVSTAISPLQLQAQQGSNSFSWSGGGTLPAGLSVSSSGLVTGTPTTVGVTQVQLLLTDQVSGYQQVVPFTWTVYATPSISAPANQTTSVGVRVSVPVSSTCPNAACTYTATNLPVGLSVNTLTGAVAGTPSAAGTTTSTVTIHDAAGATATSTSFTWTVLAAPTIATPADANIDVGLWISYPVGATCANTPCSYTLAGAPSGLTIDHATGVISGTPTTAGTYNAVTVTVTDKAGATATTAPVTVTVFAQPTVTSPGDRTTSVGATVNLTVGSSCPNTPCSYTLNNPPAGLSMTGAIITGTPTGTGTTTSTVTVTDAAGATVTSTPFTWTVKAAPTITTPANQITTVGAAVNLTPVSSCVNGPCTYSATNLPVGLSLASGTGAITGSPTATGTYNVTITVTDAAGATATTAAFTWTVKAAPTVTSPGNQATTVGATVNLTPVSTCANGTCTFTVTNLPAGLTLAPGTGAITGKPTTTGSSTVTITVRDSSGVTGSATFTWTIYAAPTITTPANQVTSVGATVNVAVGSTCPHLTCTYTVTALPAGLSINATTGVISGTPTTTGTTNSIVTVTDASGVTAATATFTWTVKAAPTITTPANQTTTVGATVSVGVGPTCANGACTYTVTALPAGLVINPQTGVISGTPTTVGTTNSIVTVTDAAGVTATTSTFTWTVKAAPTITTPANQTTTVGATVSVAVGSTCANGSCTYTVPGLPAGLVINATTGVISGTPTTTGTTNSTVTVTDAAGVTATTSTFTWTVKAAPTITTPANQTTSVGAAVSVAVSGTCFNTPCVYTAPALPAGLTINATTGVITGTPTTAGTTSSTVTIRDAAGVTATTATFTWTVRAAPTVTSPGNQATTVGATVNLTPVSTCANGTCTYSVTNLPAGLTFATGTGAITGKPTTTGSSTVTITVRDAAGSTNSTTFTWTIYAVPTITTPANQTVSVGATVNLGVGSTCANGPCGYTVSALPAGLTINATTGVISGTPTTAGTTSSTVTIRDASGVTATTATFTWTVKAAPTVTAPGNQTTSVGASVSVAVSATCPSTCTYTLNNAPAGLSMTGATITGRPTAAGTTTSTVTIRDASGATATSAAFTWTVLAAPTVVSPGDSSLEVGVALTYPVGSTCANTPCTFSLTGAPAGLTINSTTGVISGTPTTAGVYTAVVVTITDAAGASASTPPFTVTVYARPTITSPGNQTSTINTALILPISSTCPNASCSYVLSGAPAGLNIDSGTGQITGTPSATGTSPSVRVTMTDAAGVAVDTGTFSWTVYAKPTITTPANQSTVNNAAVSLALTKSCPDTPCAYRLNGGPAGLSITSAGVVSGTVTSAPRTFTGVTITVTDSAGATVTSGTFTWTVTAAPVGHWAVEEATNSATLTDSSGNGHNAALTGSGYSRSSSEAQGTYALNLTGNAAATASGTVLDTSGSFTVSTWVRLTSTSATQTFVSQDGTNVSAFALQYNAASKKFVFSRPASDSASASVTTASGTGTPITGQWYHLTGVHDATANTLTLFVNGVQQGNPVAYSTGWNASGTGKFVIGRGWASKAPSYYATATLDDIRAYSNALSVDAITQLSQALYWPLDEGTGTTANDSSLANVDGTLNSGASWTPGVVGPNAVSLNASSGAVTGTGPAVDTSQSFTVNAYARADAATAGGNSIGTVVSIDGSNVSAFAIVAYGGHWALARPATDSASAAITLASATAAITAGQWYELSAVYDSVAKTLTLYVNGVQQASAAFTGGFEGTGNFVVGRAKIGSTSYFFGGAVDDVQAFQFAADQPTVTASTSLTPPTPAAPTAVAGTTSATVSWSAPVPIAGNPTTGYVVTPYLDGVAQTPVTYTSTATSQTLNGLTTGGSYTFSVAAVNANGASTASPVSGSVLVS